MKWKIKLQKKVNELINSSGQLTYRTNIVYLERYCQSLIHFSGLRNINTAVEYYLSLFTKVEDLSTSKIEEYYYEMVQDCFNTMINYDDFDKLKGEGVYFICNEEGSVLYVGRTNDLSKRPLQSFICKFPLGVSWLKIYPTSSSETIEAVMIDYFLPIYNSKKESFNLTHRDYTQIVNVVKNKLINDIRPIYPIIKKDNLVEDELDVLDDVENVI